MDYKELYTEALKRARELSKTVTGANYEYIFPELAESEGERIRKGLVKAFGTIGKKDWGGLVVGDILDWLEKQGEHPHAELGQSKVTKISDQELEPKFHEGDWIVNNVCLPMQIASIKDGMYIFTEGDAISVSFIDENYHLWTIEDAKDGDVLACPSDLGDRMVVFIFKQLVNHASEIDCHCCIDANGIFDPCLNDCCYVGDVSRADYIPATKEQRDLLFHKMKEAGYEWNAEKKELKMFSFA